MTDRLIELARQMRAEAVERPDAAIARSLGGGARLGLKCQSGQMSLLVYRVNVEPSETEIRVFRGAFGVPQDVLAEKWEQRSRRDPEQMLKGYRFRFVPAFV